VCQWNRLGYQQFIIDDQVLRGQEMNSIQQGFLCSSTEHRMFDDYSIGVNPDVRYDVFTESSSRKFHYRIITGFTTLSTVAPDAPCMAELFIET
jgi:hypothetical protein